MTKEVADLPKESVVLVKGKVNARPANQVRKEMVTGDVEVEASHIEVFSKAQPSLPLDFNVESSEETRLKFRYLDLRRSEMQKKLLTYLKLCQIF